MEDIPQPTNRPITRAQTRWTRIYDLVVHRILHTEDRPHRLALGFAIGAFVAFTPTVGIQMPICFALAWLMSANRIVGLPLVWISNPATFIPIYYPCYRLGCRLTGAASVGPEWFAAAFAREAASWSDQFGLIGSRFLEIAIPLWAGCLTVAAVIGAATYFAMLAFIRHHRARHSISQLGTMQQLSSPATDPE